MIIMFNVTLSRLILVLKKSVKFKTNDKSI